MAADRRAADSAGSDVSIPGRAAWHPRSSGVSRRCARCRATSSSVAICAARPTATMLCRSVGPDHLPALRGRPDDRAAGGRARAFRARDRHRQRLPDRDPRSAGTSGLQSRAHTRAGARGDRAHAGARARQCQDPGLRRHGRLERRRPFDRILVTAGRRSAPRPVGAVGRRRAHAGTGRRPADATSDPVLERERRVAAERRRSTSSSCH